MIKTLFLGSTSSPHSLAFPNLPPISLPAASPRDSHTGGRNNKAGSVGRVNGRGSPSRCCQPTFQFLQVHYSLCLLLPPPSPSLPRSFVAIDTLLLFRYMLCCRGLRNAILASENTIADVLRQMGAFPAPHRALTLASVSLHLFVLLLRCVVTVVICPNDIFIFMIFMELHELPYLIYKSPHKVPFFGLHSSMRFMSEKTNLPYYKILLHPDSICIFQSPF